MAEVIGLDAPRTGERYLKMYWTAKRLSPTSVRWDFRSAWERERAIAYLKNQFAYREELELQKSGEFSLTMTYVHVRAEPVTL